ncbi:MAG: TonB-dependent receptor plug domain-containing protein [Brevundimonas sp.]
MTTTSLITTAAAAALMFAAPQAFAQTAAPPAAPTDGGQGVLTFTPDFFAAQRPNTALDMVERIPGFSVEDGDGSRGFEGAVGNVLINGARPASKNDSGSSVLSRTLARQVERIELIRGGAPGIDMQGYAAVVNVILKDEASREHVLEVTPFIFEGDGQDLVAASYRFTARSGDRTWGVTLSDGVGISDANGPGVSIRRDGTGAVTREEAFWNDQFGGGTAGRVNYAGPLLGGRIDLTARYGTNDFHSTTRLSSTGVLRESLYDEDGSSGEFGAVYTRDLSPSLTSETRFIHEFGEFENAATNNNLEAGVQSPEQRFTSEGENGETILRSLVQYERSPTLSFELGGEVAYNMLEVDQAFTIGGAPVPLPSDQVKVEETRGEAFGKTTWRARSDLTLEGGLRLEASTISQSGDADAEKTFYYAKPRFLATWTPMARTQFRLRLEREVGQLDFGDFAASAELDDENVFGGNVDLEPEQRWIGEVAFERRFLEDGIVSVTYRHDEISDVIDRIPLPGDLSAIGNIGDGTLDQLSVNVVVPMDWAGFTGGQFGFRNTWNHSEVVDPTTGETRPISDLRRSQAVISVQQDIESWRFQWGGAWIPKLGNTFYDPDQTSGFRGRDYFELWAEYKPTQSWAIRAQLNLWDDFSTFREVYADRATRAIDFTEDRQIDPRTFLQVRVRKTF